MNPSMIISAALGILRLFSQLGLNVRELVDLQERADAEGRDVTDAEVQAFLDQARAAGRSAQDAIDNSAP